MSKNNQQPPLIPADLEAHFEEWYQVIELREIGNIVFLPNTGKMRRLLNFDEWLQKNKNLFLEITGFVDIKKEFYVGKHSLESYLLSLEKNQVLVIYDTEAFFKDDTYFILEELLIFQLKHQLPIFFVFFSSLAECQKYTSFFNQVNIKANFFLFPLHDFANISQFCLYLQNKWDLQVTNQEIKKIYQYTGGYLWIVKEIFRQMKKNACSLDEAMIAEPVRWKAASIWQALPKDLKEAICNYYQESDSQVVIQSKSALQPYNLLFNNGQLPGFIIEQLQQSQSIVLEQDHLLINNRDVSHIFSEAELELVIYLLNNQEKVLPKEELAEVYWGNQWRLSFSAWAFDQLIYRLRKKINKAKIPFSIITKRGQGYVCRKK